MRGMFNPARPWNNVDGIPVGGIVFTTSNPDVDLYVSPNSQKFKVSDYPGLEEAGFDTSPYGSAVDAGFSAPNQGRRISLTHKDSTELVSISFDGRYQHSSDDGVTWSAICFPPTQPQVRAAQNRVFGGDIYASDLTWDPVSSNYIMVTWAVSWNGDSSYNIGWVIWRTATLGGAWTYVSWTTSGASNQVNINVAGGLKFHRMPDGSILMCDGFSRIYRKAPGASLITGSWSQMTLMHYIDGTQSSSLFLAKSDSGELLIYNRNKATYRTSVDNGLTWVNRTCPVPIQTVQYGPLGWLLVAGAWANTTRRTTDHVTFPIAAAANPVLKDEFSGRTFSSFMLICMPNKIRDSASSLYVLRCVFSDYMSTQVWVMFSYDLVNWALEPLPGVTTDNGVLILSYDDARMWFGLQVSTAVSERGPYITLPSLPATLRGLSPFMKVK